MEDDPRVVCSGALGEGLEFVKDVELVAALCANQAEGGGDEGGKHGPVVADAMTGVEIREACSCCGNSEWDSWCRQFSLLSDGGALHVPAIAGETIKLQIQYVQGDGVSLKKE